MTTSRTFSVIPPSPLTTFPTTLTTRSDFPELPSRTLFEIEVYIRISSLAWTSKKNLFSSVYPLFASKNRRVSDRFPCEKIISSWRLYFSVGSIVQIGPSFNDWKRLEAYRLTIWWFGANKGKTAHSPHPSWTLLLFYIWIIYTSVCLSVINLPIYLVH